MGVDQKPIPLIFKYVKSPHIQFNIKLMVIRKKVYLVNHMMENKIFKIDIFYFFIALYFLLKNIFNNDKQNLCSALYNK